MYFHNISANLPKNKKCISTFHQNLKAKCFIKKANFKNLMLQSLKLKLQKIVKPHKNPIYFAHIGTQCALLRVKLITKLRQFLICLLKGLYRKK
jgi:hypothetical protein